MQMCNFEKQSQSNPIKDLKLFLEIPADHRWKENRMFSPTTWKANFDPTLHMIFSTPATDDSTQNNNV